MSSQSLFHLVLSKCPVVKNIFVSSNSGSLLLFGYGSNTVVVNKLQLTKTDEKQVFDGEVLRHDKNIINIFDVNSKHYGVDERGGLFPISLENSTDLMNVDYDLFDDSPEKSEKWILGSLLQMLNDSEVINACVNPDGLLALLTTSKSIISLVLTSVPSGEVVKTITLRNTSLTLAHNKEECIVKWIPSNNIVNDFYLNWFKYERERTGFFLVTLPDGAILAVFPESGEVEYLYVWFSSFILAHWDFSHDKECPELGFCKLILISGCGGILILNELGEVSTYYLPVAQLKALHYASSGILYFSDWKSSFSYSILPSNQCLALPLKGIITWGGWGGSQTLALSSSGDLYALENNYVPHTNVEQLFPNSDLTAELIQKNSKLEEINFIISQTDTYIEAMLLSKRQYDFVVTAQMVAVRGNDCTVCFVIKCITEDFIINKNDWLLSLSVTSDSHGTAISCHELRDSILTNLPLTQIFRFKLMDDSHYHLSLNLRLIFKHLPPFAQYLPVILVGQVNMDPSFFLLPATDVINDKSNDHCASFKKITQFSTGKKLNPTEETKFNILRKVSIPESTVCINLLKNSRALWRSSLWDKAAQEERIQLSVLNKIVTVEATDKHVTIISKDPTASYLVKEALFATSIDGCIFCAELQKTLELIHEYEASCDILKYKDEVPLEKIKELWVAVRENITSKFIP